MSDSGDGNIAAAAAEGEVEALHSAAVSWKGPRISGGSGTVTLDSGAAAQALALTWESRTEPPGGRTSPEELLSAGLASCFSMLPHTRSQSL